MSADDRFEHDDAAYVLGALGPDERAAFEAHLRTCPACAARVRELTGLPALLGTLTAADLDSVVASERVPDTVLAGLLRRAGRERRRRRATLTALASVAAACVAALVLVLWPAGPARHGSVGAPVAAGRPFVAVLAAVPVHATAWLTAHAWGTGISVRCGYARGAADRAYTYGLSVTSADGRTERLGSWTLPAGGDIEFTAVTSLPIARIASIAITRPDGAAVLRVRI